MTISARRRPLLPSVAPAALFALLAVAVCGLAAGPSLNFFLGLLCFSAILIPPLVLRLANPLRAWTAASIPAAIFIVADLIVAARLHLPPLAGLRCAAVLVTFALALVAAAWLGESLRLPPVPVAAACTLLALAWLTAPLWAFRNLSPAALNRLIAIQPVFATNAAAIDAGIWTEQRMTYQITTLGQDVPYALPTSIAPCIDANLIAAVVLIVIAIFARSARRSVPAPSPSGRGRG